MPSVKLLRDLDYHELVEGAEPYLRAVETDGAELRARAAPFLRGFNPDQERDERGRFAPGDGDDDGGDDEGGAYGFGVDSHGVSYTDFDVDQGTGEPRFSEEYRQQYGPVLNETPLGAEDQYAIAITGNGSLHVADDTRGTQNREVLQEFRDNPQSLDTLGGDVHDARENGFPDGEFVNGDGYRVGPAPDGGVTITWRDGKKTTFDRDVTDDFTDATDGIGKTYAKEKRGGFRSAQSLLRK